MKQAVEYLHRKEAAADKVPHQHNTKKQHHNQELSQQPQSKKRQEQKGLEIEQLSGKQRGQAFRQDVANRSLWKNPPGDKRKYQDLDLYIAGGTGGFFTG